MRSPKREARKRKRQEKERETGKRMNKEGRMTIVPS